MAFRQKTKESQARQKRACIPSPFRQVRKEFQRDAKAAVLAITKISESTGPVNAPSGR
jgi:hypothetical protein